MILKENEIIEGNYIPLLGYVKIKKRMYLNDIKELIIFKNEKKYSEIRAISSNDFLIVKTMANKIPAEEKLKEIQTKINYKKELIQKIN